MINKHILIIAGEESGDMHGAALIREMKKLDKDLEFSGIGGDRMIAEGLDAHFHSSDMAFLGFVEVVKHLPFIIKVKRTLLKLVEVQDIKRVILIDYPGFNLNIAENLKKMGLDVIYYISPQLWAWNKGRIDKVKKLVDKMLVVFPFEEEMYKEAGIDAEFVGHPILERMDDYEYHSADEINTYYGLTPGKPYILVMPGSRMQEINRIYPEVKKAAKRIADKYDLEVVVACAGNIDEDVIEAMSKDVNFHVIKGKSYDLLNHAKFAIVKSGTSTLETALFGVPFVVVYKTSRLTYEMGKRLIKVDHIAMPNIVSGKGIVKELIQNDVNANKIFEVASEYLNDPKKYDAIKAELNGVRSKLGEPGASANAAKIICERINNV